MFFLTNVIGHNKKDKINSKPILATFLLNNSRVDNIIFLV